MDDRDYKMLNGRQSCFAFDGIGSSIVKDDKLYVGIKCKALKVDTASECLQCKFFKTNAEIESQKKTIAEKLGLKIKQKKAI